MTPPAEPLRKPAPSDSATMLSALGILAYAASMMTHEALGHGVYCIAAGGHNTMLTAWRETCEFPGAPAIGIKAAGPGVQFGAGLLAWLVLRLLPPNPVRLRCFLWLCMVFNLLVSSGYVAFSGVTDFGDAAELTAGLHPHFLWRGGLILLGSAVYFLSMQAAAIELNRFAAPDDRTRRLFRIVSIPYAAAGVFACFTAALNRTMQDVNGGRGAAIGMAAASSFAAGLGIFFLPRMQRRMTSKETSPAFYLHWSAAWGALAAIVIVAFLFFIGPGLQ